MWSDLGSRDLGFGIQSLREVAFDHPGCASRVPNPKARYLS
jgi:hypothetical protein